MSPRVGLYLFRCNEKFYPSVVVCTATTDDGNRSSTVCACGSPKQGPCNLPRGVYGDIIEILTDLVTRPAQCEPKEHKFGMVFYDIVRPWSVALGDPAVRMGRTTPKNRKVAARSWNQEKTGVLDWTARGSPPFVLPGTGPGRMAEFSNPVEVETGGLKAFSVPTQACDGDGFDHNSTTSAAFSLAVTSHNARIIHGPSLFLRIFVSIRIVGWPSLPLLHK